jgi:hypothetical protein
MIQDLNQSERQLNHRAQEGTKPLTARPVFHCYQERYDLILAEFAPSFGRGVIVAQKPLIFDRLVLGDGYS